MAIFWITTPENEECCACENAIPCGCCGDSEDFFSENHDFDECPDVAKPCGNKDSGSCSGATIYTELFSDPFPNECFTSKNPKCSFNLGADNYAIVFGGKIPWRCPNFATDECVTCSGGTVIEPMVEKVDDKHKRMKITVWAQNAPHGGPYGLSIYAIFYFEQK